MIDLFWWYMTTLGFVCVVVGLLCLYRYFLGNKILAQTSKLKSMMANFKQQYPEIEAKRGDIVASGLGDIGIEGIMDELGIDPGLLKNPLVKGLIEKYAPRILEQMQKGGTGGNKSKGEEIPLL